MKKQVIATSPFDTYRRPRPRSPRARGPSGRGNRSCDIAPHCHPGGSLGGAAQLFADKTLVSKVDNYGQYAELELASGADAQQILQRLVASGARLSKFELQEASLHKIFIDLVGPEAVRA